MTSPVVQHESPWPHRFAVLLCCATFPLIWVGGLVTTHDAGMAVHDWPSTYGYNLFLYPLKTWIFAPFDIFVEHGHRLLGAVVGLITIGFVAAVFLRDRRLWLRMAAMAALAMVIGQGVLGGQRVIQNERMLAQLHGCIGPLFFGFAATLAVMTSRLWREHRPGKSSPGDSRLIRFGWVTVGLLFVQVVLGSFLRHGTTSATRDQFRLYVVFHLLVAVVVTVHLILWYRRAAAHPLAAGNLKWPARGLVALIALQMALGAATWIVNYGWPSWFHAWDVAAAYRIQAQGLLQSMVVTGHVATGSLLLATAAVLATRQTRLLSAAAPLTAHSASLRSLKGVLA